jgi:hypothetical protein
LKALKVTNRTEAVIAVVEMPVIAD